MIATALLFAASAADVAMLTYSHCLEAQARRLARSGEAVELVVDAAERRCLEQELAYSSVETRHDTYKKVRVFIRQRAIDAAIEVKATLSAPR